MPESSNKRAPAKPPMAFNPSTFDPMTSEATFIEMPAYLLEAVNAEGGGKIKVLIDRERDDGHERFDPSKPVTFAKAYLPSLTIALPTDSTGKEIEAGYECKVYSQGGLFPYCMEETGEEIMKRMVTLELSVRVNRWYPGWPEGVG